MTIEHGVTLWGAPGAGKSGLLGALYAASLRTETDGWSAHPKDCEDAYTQERLKDAYLGLRGRTNTKTGLPAAGSEYPPLRAVLRRRRAERAAELRVAIVDPAGEYSTQLELGATSEGRALFSRIANGTGLLWLVEAGQRPDDVAARVAALQHLVALLEQGGGRQLAIPVALCLSKTDRLSAQERTIARADPGTVLRAHLGETAFTWFEAACPRLRCFAITSTGAEDGRVQPEGIDAVFDWLAEESRPRVTMRERVDRATGALKTLGALASSLRPAVTPSARQAMRSAAVTVGLLAVLGGAAAVGGPRVMQLANGRGQTTTRTVTSTGVTAPARELATDVAEAQLGRALDAAENGAWSEALGALDGTPPSSLRFAWDSLYVAASVAAAALANDVSSAKRLREAARTRASEMIRRGPAGSRRLAAVRYARGVACVDGALDCPRADVIADFTWALLGTGQMRRDSHERLAALGAETRE